MKGEVISTSDAYRLENIIRASTLSKRPALHLARVNCHTNNLYIYTIYTVNHSLYFLLCAFGPHRHILTLST